MNAIEQAYAEQILKMLIRVADATERIAGSLEILALEATSPKIIGVDVPRPATPAPWQVVFVPAHMGKRAHWSIARRTVDNTFGSGSEFYLIGGKPLRFDLEESAHAWLKRHNAK